MLTKYFKKEKDKVLDTSKDAFGVLIGNAISSQQNAVNGQWQSSIFNPDPAVWQGVQSMQAQAAVKQRFNGWVINIEQVEDGLVVEVRQRYSTGMAGDQTKRFIATDINDAAQKILAGAVLLKIDT